MKIRYSGRANERRLRDGDKVLVANPKNDFTVEIDDDKGRRLVEKSSWNEVKEENPQQENPQQESLFSERNKENDSKKKK